MPANNAARFLTAALVALFATAAYAQLGVEVTESGNISLSADGAGTSAASTTIHVDKPNAGATVRSAFLACARTIFDTIPIANGDVSLDGNAIAWDSVATSGFFSNGFAEVTAIVAPVVDAAPPGIVGFTQAEADSSTLEGCGLYVVFDDPTVSSSNTAFILFGAQDPAGDTFNVTLAEPLGGGDTAELGLAISFSFQALATGDPLCGEDAAMFSEIDVNGSRLTSCAGGEDDTLPSEPGANGNLITVGGIGDDVANPADPFQEPADGQLPRVREDERYDLLPFVPGTSIAVDTINPSNDDNIFAGHIFVTTPAIVGEGIVLGPANAVNEVGTDHTVTATVVDTNGNPVAGRDVTFSVVAGPNAGDGGIDTTDANGEATFTYTGDGGVGVDTIVASFVDAQGNTIVSNQVTKEWVITVVIGACCTDGPNLESECIEVTQQDCDRAGPDGGLFLGPGTSCADVEDCVPLVVTLGSLSATEVRGGVMIHWTTELEVDTVGFRVLRQVGNGREKRLEAVRGFVPATGNALSGASYELFDNSRAAGQATFYFLEDVDVFGRVTRHGPIGVDRGSRRPPARRSAR